MAEQEEQALTPDGLSDEQLDALPFGVIQVDAHGIVHKYNAAESRFSGRQRERVLGRDFFRDVAPCTNLPSFRGRFLDGVRRGNLDSVFGFVFGFDEPARVEVTMRAAAEAGRYWLLVRQLGFMAASPQRRAALAAADAVDRRVRAEPVDADVCALEPIHIPGAVQPHTAAVVIDPATDEIVACSDNIADALGRASGDVVGQSAATLFPPFIIAGIANVRAHGADASPGRPWRTTSPLGPEKRPFAVAVHFKADRLIVELEMLPDQAGDFAEASADQALDAVLEIRKTPSLTAAAQQCARHVRAMTGFERVLVYRFDEEWNGEAVAEDRDPDAYPSLLGLRFPASDIPAQARALYVNAPARFVVDRDAVPAALVARPQAGNTPVDLSLAYSRALSPIHLEYQRNLGVNGSMSISIVVDGKLWGLVIGHHRRPHYVTPPTRALATLVTDGFALRVHELATTLAWAEQQDSLEQQNALLRQLAGAEDFVTTLAPRDGVSLGQLFRSTGAAVISGERVATVGHTPDIQSLLALADWLRGEVAPDNRAFVTADLSEHWPEAQRWRDQAAGLLAVFIDAGRRNLLLWFKPQITSTVVWGGDPNEKVLADSATGTVLPRRSFERWVEERAGRSERWEEWQIDAATAFATAVERVALRQGRKIAELRTKSRDLADALEKKDLLAREIDHRVKNSLQIVASVMLLQSRQVADEQAKAAFQDTYARVMSVARVHDSLQARDDQMVNLGESLRQLCADLALGVQSREGVVEVDVDEDLLVSSTTAVAFSLIATELVTNAIKYAYPGGRTGPVQLILRGGPEGKLTLVVCDEGEGLAEDWETRQRESGGLGMRVIRALLKQIDGELEVDHDRDQGACFTVRT
ncbi:MULTISPECIES: histidine kinase dimerization/phosphoacceptor domain -containing protein [Sphingomonas]|uniref:histidine kinase dimerization/phosphoacceptor domain -containing protein n=1 Tax=Sphingomonas TaxID=13687 RepID=UPI001962C491|nr:MULTISPECIES: histidine kinase dimerization/phosphoacceptor domain -containing protein [Sphingomonas]